MVNAILRNQFQRNEAVEFWRHWFPHGNDAVATAEHFQNVNKSDTNKCNKIVAVPYGMRMWTWM